MLQHTILACALISTFLFVIAAAVYPGGSLADSNSVGFVWSKNFISNLFQEQAINGADNPGRVWALIAMAVPQAPAPRTMIFIAARAYCISARGQKDLKITAAEATRALQQPVPVAARTWPGS